MEVKGAARARRRHLLLRLLERQRRLASSSLQMLDVVVDPSASSPTSTCPRRTKTLAVGPVGPNNTANLSARSRIRNLKRQAVGASGAAGGLQPSTMPSSEGLASSSQPSSSSTTVAPTLAAAAIETPFGSRTRRRSRCSSPMARRYSSTLPKWSGNPDASGLLP